jgi:hypothetical protein
MSHADVVSLFDLVTVVAGTFGHAGVRAVAAPSVQVALVGDLAVDLGDQVGQVLRGKTPPDR